MKRLAIGFPDDTYADLEEVARLEESSIAHVVRDCVRAVLPQLLEVTRFMEDPRRSKVDVLAFADQMDRALGLLAAASKVASGDVEGDDGKPPRFMPRPPSSNTGVNPDTEGGSDAAS